MKQVWSASGPWLTFALTVGLAFYLYMGGSSSHGRITGFAEADSRIVASVESGRITSVSVQTGQDVVPGQIIATLDTTALDAEIAVADAERARLAAQVPASLAAEAQRLDESVEQLERELMREQEEFGRVRSEQKMLDEERARAKKLVEDKLAVSDELSRLDVRYSTIKPMADSKPRTIELLKKQLASAEKRRKEAADARSEVEKSTAGGDLLVTTRKLERLKQRRNELVLRANVAGRVAQIYRHAGEVVKEGEPIVSTVSTHGRVVACVPETQALRVGVGDKAKLWFRDASGEPLSGTAITVGPLVTEVPVRCRRVPTMPAWGREVTIAIDQPVELVAGQAFNIDFDHSVAPAAPSAAPSTTPVAPGSKPALMDVPATLRSRSRLEPSGALWRPDLQRYVIVSDDTGHKDAGERAPWLFAMSRDGVIDPEPLPIAGISEIDDLESIAAGDNGEIYVLSSQSFSKRGKRPAPRTSFVRLMPEGRSFRADAEIHLSAALEEAGADVMTRLGLPNGTKELEIEGMGFHNGAIYLGLKAPLDAQGNAMIWKLGNPAALFKDRNIAKADLTLWARARVDADVDGKTAGGGISELLFLPDGSLMITSTPSTQEGTTESGRLWHVAAPAEGTLAPQEVRTFQGLKPEGLSLSPTPGRFLVVFDSGGDVPSWTEIPWPA